MRSKQPVQETAGLAVSAMNETRRQTGVMKIEQAGGKAGNKVGRQ